MRGDGLPDGGPRVLQRKLEEAACPDARARAARLGVQPQMVRYRLRQIRELWGGYTGDPDVRFELQLVLRAMRLRGELS